MAANLHWDRDALEQARALHAGALSGLLRPSERVSDLTITLCCAYCACQVFILDRVPVLVAFKPKVFVKMIEICALVCLISPETLHS